MHQPDPVQHSPDLGSGVLRPVLHGALQIIDGRKEILDEILVTEAQALLLLLQAPATEILELGLQAQEMVLLLRELLDLFFVESLELLELLGQELDRELVGLDAPRPTRRVQQPPASRASKAAVASRRASAISADGSIVSPSPAVSLESDSWVGRSCRPHPFIIDSSSIGRST